MQRYIINSTYNGEKLSWFVFERYGEDYNDPELEWQTDTEATRDLPADEVEDAIMYRQQLRGMRDEQFTEQEAIDFQKVLLRNGYEAHVESVPYPKINDGQSMSLYVSISQAFVKGIDICPDYDLPFSVAACVPSRLPPDIPRLE